MSMVRNVFANVTLVVICGMEWKRKSQEDLVKATTLNAAKTGEDFQLKW